MDETDHDLLVRIDERVCRMTDTVDDHTPRISKLEQFRSYCIGCMGVIVLLIGWVKQGGG